jgi:hypothetical protein
MYRELLLLFVITLLVITSGCTTTIPNTQPSVQPTTGSLNISSTPQGSEIYLDGVYRGTTPSTIPDVPNGSHYLELRYREYNSWSKSVEIQGGNTSYVDATLSPIVTQTSVPTTEPTARPTTPVPKTVGGCWKFEHSTGNTTFAYIYELKSSGTGWMYGTKTSPTKTESMTPESITWSIDPHSAVVTILEANPRDPADPDTWVLTYDENADILDGGEKGQVFMIYVRVPC